MRSAVVGFYVWSGNVGSVLCSGVRCHCVGSGTVLFVCYHGIKDRTVTTGVLGCGIALAALIWIPGPWFLVAVDFRHSVWVMLICLSMLGLVLIWIG